MKPEMLPKKFALPIYPELDPETDKPRLFQQRAVQCGCDHDRSGIVGVDEVREQIRMPTQWSVNVDRDHSLLSRHLPDDRNNFVLNDLRVDVVLQAVRRDW